jgi:hypothetical protein
LAITPKVYESLKLSSVFRRMYPGKMTEVKAKFELK